MYLYRMYDQDARKIMKTMLSYLFFQNPITLSPAEHEAYEKFKEKLKAFDGVDAIYDNINIED